MSQILISTITPCFRMKAYLKRFLEELPHQTYFNHLEVVLDHNEPDDEELQWISEFQKQHPGRLKHIITNPVEPIGTSMNRCIREASAPLLTIWNVDDLRTPDSIELQVNAFEAGADIVYGNFEVVRSFGSMSGQLTDFSNFSPDSNEFTRSMLLGPFMAFRKSLCEKAGYFDEQLKSGADFDLAIRLAFHGKPMMATGLLGYYLNEGKGASTRADSKQALERTVIELRYGIYDKLDYDFVVPSLSYDIGHVHVQGKHIPLADLVPQYETRIKESSATLTLAGLNKYAYGHVFHIKQIKRFFRNILKKLYNLSRN